MKSIFYLFFVLGATFQFAAAADAPAVIHTVDFRQTDNLKAIFDAGIRPTRVLGLESEDCEFGKERLRFLLPGNLDFSVDSESCDVSVLAENKIVSIALYAPQMKLAEGIEYTRKVATELGMDTKDLDQKKIDDGSRDYVDKLPAWSGYLAKGNIEIQLRLEYARTRYIAFTELRVGISWDQPGSITHPLMDPIQPPPGYENVSMDPPPPIPSTGKPNPEHDVEYYRKQFHDNYMKALARQAGQATGTQSSDIQSSGTQGNSPKSQSKPAPHTPSSISDSLLTPQIGWWVLLGVLLLLFAVYAFRRNK